MKLLFFFAFLIACYSVSNAAECLYGPVCNNHGLTSFENGQIYCCQSGYHNIVTSVQDIDGFNVVHCICQ
nr:hypothetical protein BgiMline_021535 [Biomphalaria glabrata]